LDVLTASRRCCRGCSNYRRRVLFSQYDRVYIPWELAEPRPLREVFEYEARTTNAMLVIIGPEGGFSASEVARAQDAGAIAISLGPRILRTETAALVVVSALLYARGIL
jgi:16S rRNA (uracil1498-N3)-methyltransferase